MKHEEGQLMVLDIDNRAKVRAWRQFSATRLARSANDEAHF